MFVVVYFVINSVQKLLDIPLYQNSLPPNQDSNQGFPKYKAGMLTTTQQYVVSGKCTINK
jgi:hypothetical protein